jgi:hypothetical protein
LTPYDGTKVDVNSLPIITSVGWVWTFEHANRNWNQIHSFSVLVLDLKIYIAACYWYGFYKKLSYHASPSIKVQR